LDTSVFGVIRDVEFAECTRRLFQAIVAGYYVGLVSPETVRELEGAPQDVRELLDRIPAGSLERVALNEEVRSLAEAYVEAGVVTRTHESDALHVAAATVARADLIVSWNFRHMVNYDRIRKFNGVNAMEGYPAIEIRSPLEMQYGDEDKDV
jgi:hypothetical protein